MTLSHFAWIGGIEVLATGDGLYVCFIADLDVCNDGTGPSHGDPYYQNATAYSPSLNADKDQYVVTPPQIRSGVKPVVMGCQARVTNLNHPNSRSYWGVVGDIGPKAKLGECAYCLAKQLNPQITYNAGDSRTIYLYEFFPGTAAIVDGTTYKLKPAG